MSEELPYRLIRKIGEGGFGSVHLAEARETGQKVAVKFCHPHLVQSELPRIRREAELLRGIRHPSLVSLEDFQISTSQGPALVYEWIEGQNLRTVLKDRSASLLEVVSWLKDLAAGISVLHRHGLVHRDIKPENCILGVDGLVRLLDYGLLKEHEQGGTVTKEGWILGTPVYMAPELLRGERATPGSDTYSLAAMAYEWIFSKTFLTSSKALLQSDFEETLRPRLRELKNKGPLGEHLAQSLAPRPQDRPGSIEEFSSGLEEALRTGLVAGSPPKLDPEVPRSVPPETRLASPTVPTSPERTPSAAWASQRRFLRKNLTRWVGLGMLLAALWFGWGPRSQPDTSPLFEPGPSSSFPTLLVDWAPLPKEVLEDFPPELEARATPRVRPILQSFSRWIASLRELESQSKEPDFPPVLRAELETRNFFGQDLADPWLQLPYLASRKEVREETWKWISPGIEGWVDLRQAVTGLVDQALRGEDILLKEARILWPILTRGMAWYSPQVFEMILDARWNPNTSPVGVETVRRLLFSQRLLGLVRYLPMKHSRQALALSYLGDWAEEVRTSAKQPGPWAWFERLLVAEMGFLFRAPGFRERPGYSRVAGLELRSEILQSLARDLPEMNFVWPEGAARASFFLLQAHFEKDSTFRLEFEENPKGIRAFEACLDSLSRRTTPPRGLASLRRRWERLGVGARSPEGVHRDVEAILQASP